MPIVAYLIPQDVRIDAALATVGGQDAIRNGFRPYQKGEALMLLAQPRDGWELLPMPPLTREAARA